MAKSFTLTKNCEKDLLNAIELYLKKQEDSIDNLNKSKLYFSGEFDSNQTKFEQGSNDLEFGVLSSNKTVALVLLRFLRIIVDNRPDLFMDDICHDWENDDENGDGVFAEIGDTILIKDIVTRIAEKEEQYTSDFELDQPISVTLSEGNIVTGKIKEIVITKKLEEIEIWTLPKIIQGLQSMKGNYF